MNDFKNCPECNCELPVDAPDGLCMNCLLQAAISTGNDTTIAMDPEELESISKSSSSGPQVGRTFGDYQINGVLGAGGMGTVFDAQETHTGRRIALKVLSHGISSADLRDRFIQEGRIAASINHPNSVYVFGTEIVNGYPVIMMELVGGGTLKDRVKKDGPLPVKDAIDSVLDLLDGLEVAAQKGILHRDIKPANCFVDTDGTVKIGDFGLSISTLARGDVDPSKPESAMGTPAFASPEQLRGEDLDVRSDIYSVGSTLYFLLTGETTFKETTLSSLLMAVIEKTPVSPDSVRKDIPKQLAEVIMCCLEKNRGSRFSNYAMLRQALLPFSSKTAQPAGPVNRVIAYVFDGMVISGINILLAFGLAFLLSLRADHPRLEELSLPSEIIRVVIAILYFGFMDRSHRGSIGKRVFNIHVITKPGIPPSLKVSMARAAIFSGVLYGPPLILSFIDPQMVLTYVSGVVFFFFLAVLFSCARRKNGFIGWHDRLTDTKVVSRMPEKSARLTLPTADDIDLDNDTPDIGPYAVLSKLGNDNDGESLILGYDVRLLRKVWIQKRVAGAESVSEQMRGNSRQGNLRWITGKRTDESAWDAWEAPEGCPLLNVIKDKEWDTVRHWMADLAHELSLSDGEKTMPDELGADRLWITHDGHIKLLPFKAPGIRNDAPKADSIPSSRPGAVQQLLRQIYELSGMNARPVPLYASTFFNEMTEKTPVSTLASTVKGFTTRQTRLSRGAHYVHLLPALLCIFNIMVAIAALASYTLTFTSSPKGVVIGRLLSKHESSETMHQFLSKTEDSELKQSMISGLEKKRDAIETYIAGQFPDYSTTHEISMPISPIQLVELLKILNAELKPTPEELAEAEKMLIAEFGKDIFKETLMTPSTFTEIHQNWPEVDLSQHSPGLIFLAPHITLAFCGIIAILSAAIFRQNLLFKLSGVAVVDRRGREATRLRRGVRALLTFSPFILGCCITALFAATDGDLTILSGYLGALLVPAGILAFYPVALGKRSPQDILSGTYLVIR